MNATVYLQRQFANLNTVLHGVAGDLTDEEWVSRPAPGQNPIGYTVWHLPRTQDTFVQTWIRGMGEVAHTDRWAVWRPLRSLGAGIGVSLAEADHIAHSVKKVDVLAYADEVYQTIDAWLRTISDDDLDDLPDARQRLAAFPEYQTPGFDRDVRDLYEQPVWGLMIRPCTGHVHRHLGELQAIKRIVRTAG